ncbi:hypothetical protein M9458_039242, partial [Cirrhinus mrigala]
TGLPGATAIVPAAPHTRRAGAELDRAPGPSLPARETPVISTQRLRTALLKRRRRRALSPAPRPAPGPGPARAPGLDASPGGIRAPADGRQAS